MHGLHDKKLTFDLFNLFGIVNLGHHCNINKVCYLAFDIDISLQKFNNWKLNGDKVKIFVPGPEFGSELMIEIEEKDLDNDMVVGKIIDVLPDSVEITEA